MTKIVTVRHGEELGYALNRQEVLKTTPNAKISYYQLDAPNTPSLYGTAAALLGMTAPMRTGVYADRLWFRGYEVVGIIVNGTARALSPKDIMVRIVKKAECRLLLHLP